MYKKVIINEEIHVVFDSPVQYDSLIPIASVPIELIVNRTGTGNKTTTSIRWCSVYDPDELRIFMEELSAYFKNEEVEGYAKISLGVECSREAMSAYRTLLDIVRKTEYMLTTSVIEREKGKLLYKNVPLNERTLNAICKNNMWDVFNLKRQQAQNLFVRFEKNQDRKVSDFSPKGKLESEKDADETYLYFYIPGSTFKILGSYSLMNLMKSKFPGFPFDEVSIGPGKIISSHSQGRGYKNISYRESFKKK